MKPQTGLITSRDPRNEMTQLCNVLLSEDVLDVLDHDQWENLWWKLTRKIGRRVRHLKIQEGKVRLRRRRAERGHVSPSFLPHASQLFVDTLRSWKDKVERGVIYLGLSRPNVTSNRSSELRRYYASFLADVNDKRYRYHAYDRPACQPMSNRSTRNLAINRISRGTWPSRVYFRFLEISFKVHDWSI